MSHPIVAAVSDIRTSLKSVADANPTFMSTDDKATALSELVRAEAQLAELRLRILTDAGDLADVTSAKGAAKDAAGWLAQTTRMRFTDARADLTLATALDRNRPVLAAAMREGGVSLAQAHVIHRALTALPAAVDADTIARAEAHLVEQAGEFGPKELGRIGRRILDVVAPDIAEQAEAARLADLEANVAERTRLTLRRLGDGTTRISGRVPDHIGTRLATYLEAFTNPRTHRRRTAGAADAADDAAVSDPLTRLPIPSVSGRRSPSSSKPSTRPACRYTAATPPPSSSPSPSPHSRPTSPPPTSSAPASSPSTLPTAATSPATGSPPAKPDASPAPRTSCPPSSAAAASPSTSAAPAGSSAGLNASP